MISYPFSQTKNWLTRDNFGYVQNSLVSDTVKMKKILHKYHTNMQLCASEQRENIASSSK